MSRSIAVQLCWKSQLQIWKTLGSQQEWFLQGVATQNFHPTCRPMDLFPTNVAPASPRMKGDFFLSQQPCRCCGSVFWALPWLYIAQPLPLMAADGCHTGSTISSVTPENNCSFTESRNAMHSAEKLRFQVTEMQIQVSALAIFPKHVHPPFTFATNRCEFCSSASLQPFARLKSEYNLKWKLI